MCGLLEVTVDDARVGTISISHSANKCTDADKEFTIMENDKTGSKKVVTDEFMHVAMMFVPPQIRQKQAPAKGVIYIDPHVACVDDNMEANHDSHSEFEVGGRQQVLVPACKSSAITKIRQSADKLVSLFYILHRLL